MANGEQISRTTREWATSLKLSSTGDSARCDIVNGGADSTANLLVPSLFYQEMVEEVSRYKLRINPLARREARFRDKIPGLPEVIHIDLSVQESLDCLEQMSSEDMWKKAPSSVRSPNSSDPDPPIEGVASSRSYASAMSQGTDDSPLTQKTNPSEKTGRPSKNGGSKTATDRRQDDTASTHSGLTPSVAFHGEKYKELEQALNNQQTQLNKGLTNMETQLKKLQRLDDLETKMMKSMQHHVDTNSTLRQMQDQMEKMMIMLRNMNEGTKRTAKQLQQASRTVTQNPTMEESTLSNATGDGSQASILYQDTIPLHEMEDETTHSQENDGSWVHHGLIVQQFHQCKTAAQHCTVHPLVTVYSILYY